MATRSVKKQNPARTPAPADPAAVASPAPSGPPRWTFGLAAIVGAVALGWQIVSHFIPKVEAPNPPASPVAAPPTVAQPPAPTPGPISATATGPGGVAIGQMTGGSVQAGVAAAPQAGVAPSAATSSSASGSRP